MNEWKIELDREEDGRWIAEVTNFPGVMAYGATENEAISRAEALALRVLAAQLEQEGQPFQSIQVACA